MRFTHIWRHQRRRQCRRHSDAIKALLCSALQGVSPTALRRQSRRFRRRVSGALQPRLPTPFRGGASGALVRASGELVRVSGALLVRSSGALVARWWCAGGARFRCAFKRCLWRRASLGSIAGVVRRHLHASLGRVKGATAALLGRFISAIGGALERGCYRRH